MCFKPKVPKIADMPKPTENLEGEAVSAQLEEERKRRGFKSTIATSGAGVIGDANIRKTKTGE